MKKVFLEGDSGIAAYGGKYRTENRSLDLAM